MSAKTTNPALAHSKVLWAEDSDIDGTSDRIGQISDQLKPAQIKKGGDFTEALALVEKLDVDLILAEAGTDANRAIQFLSQVRQLRPGVPRLLLLDEVDGECLMNAINLAGVHSILTRDGSDLELASQIFEGLRLREKDEDRFSLIQRVKAQNLDLEELTSDQAALVKERTREVQLSKQEAERKVSEINRLIGFVKDLAGLVAVEELVELLREETKRFHQVREPILGYVVASRQRRLLHVRAGKVQGSQSQNPWPQGLRIRINEKDDSQFLANAFSRPFGPVLAIPLPSGKKALLEDRDEVAVLFFEHSFSSLEQESFLNFLSARLQPLSIALDRILLEQELRNTSHLWEQSFDGFEEPIAIVDMDFNLLRSNKSFIEKPQATKCFAQFGGYSEVCSGCPVEKALAGPGAFQSQVVD